MASISYCIIHVAWVCILIPETLVYIMHAWLWPMQLHSTIEPTSSLECVAVLEYMSEAAKATVSKMCITHDIIYYNYIVCKFVCKWLNHAESYRVCTLTCGG